MEDSSVRSSSDKRFEALVIIILSVCAACAILPFILLVSSSLTDENALIREGYAFIPKQFSTYAYQYLMSSNAITLDGSLYNVDGNGNRLAALIYGPRRVFVIAGWNKIVRDDASAEERVEMLAAPANTQRLHKTTPCTKTGWCMHCDSADTICNEEVFTRRPRPLGRITVLLVKEGLGY